MGNKTPANKTVHPPGLRGPNEASGGGLLPSALFTQAKRFIKTLTPDIRKQLLGELSVADQAAGTPTRNPPPPRNPGPAPEEGEPSIQQLFAQHRKDTEGTSNAQTNLLVQMATRLQSNSTGASRQLLHAIAGIKPLEDFHTDLGQMLSFFLSCANLAEGDDYRPAFTAMTMKSNNAMQVKKAVKESLRDNNGPTVSLKAFKDCVTRLLGEAHGASYAVLSEGAWPNLRQGKTETAARYASRGLELLEGHTFCIEDSDRVQKSFARHWINGLDEELRLHTITMTGDVPTMKEARTAANTAERGRRSIHSRKESTPGLNHVGGPEPLVSPMGPEFLGMIRDAVRTDIEDAIKTHVPAFTPPVMPAMPVFPQAFPPVPPPALPTSTQGSRPPCRFHQKGGCSRGISCGFPHIGPSGGQASTSGGAPASTPERPGVTCYRCQGAHYSFECPTGDGCSYCHLKTHSRARCPTAPPRRDGKYSGDRDRDRDRNRDRNRDRH